MMTTDRYYCPIRKIELINISEDGKPKPDAIKFNSICNNQDICTIIDLESTIPVKVVLFQVRYYIDDLVYYDSSPVTIRVVCHIDQECKSGS